MKLLVRFIDWTYEYHEWEQTWKGDIVCGVISALFFTLIALLIVVVVGIGRLILGMGI